MLPIGSLSLLCWSFVLYLFLAALGLHCNSRVFSSCGERGLSSCSACPGDLPNPGIEPGSPALQADSLPAEPPGKPCLGNMVPKPPPLWLLSWPAPSPLSALGAPRRAPSEEALAAKASGKTLTCTVALTPCAAPSPGWGVWQFPGLLPAASTGTSSPRPCRLPGWDNQQAPATPR